MVGTAQGMIKQIRRIFHPHGWEWINWATAIPPTISSPTETTVKYIVRPMVSQNVWSLIMAM